MSAKPSETSLAEDRRRCPLHVAFIVPNSDLHGSGRTAWQMPVFANSTLWCIRVGETGLAMLLRPLKLPFLLILFYDPGTNLFPKMYWLDEYTTLQTIVPEYISYRSIIISVRICIFLLPLISLALRHVLSAPLYHIRSVNKRHEGQRPLPSIACTRNNRGDYCLSHRSNDVTRAADWRLAGCLLNGGTFLTVKC